MARLFISHSSRNNDKAIEVRDWLAANGWDDVFLDLDPERGIVAGQRWKEALQKAAQRCELVLALISAEWLASTWCKSEIDAARLMGKKVIVALIGVDKSQVPPDLNDEQWIDLVGDPSAYTRLKEGLRRSGLDPSSFPFEAGRRPYPGFAFLDEKDPAIFFGRDAQIVRGLDKIRTLARTGVDRMLVILGASGSGKSSFFRAGLWPRLKRDDRTWLPLPTVRPERAAISGKFGLVQALHQTMSQAPFADAIRQHGLPRSRDAIQDFIDKTADGLPKILAALRAAAQAPALSGEEPPPPTVVVAVDQGEELFNEDGGDEARRFIEILTATMKADPHALVIVVMRSDSFEQLQNDALFANTPKDTFTLDKMLEGSYRTVVEGPAHLVQPEPLRIDPRLTDALLEDVSGQDALPLLAFTLAHLYENYAADNELALTDYEKLGRLRGVLATAVREAFAEGTAKGELPRDEKAQLALARLAFIPHLARVNPAGQFIRRIATRAEIPTEARPLIDRFTERRLLIRDRRKVAGEDVEVVEVAHEALLREWRELHDALLEEREFLVAKGQLEQEVAEWRAASEKLKTDALLRGNKLLRAREWLATRPLDLSLEERQFIKASSDEELAQRRRRRVAVVAALVVTSLLAVVAAYAAWKATEQSAIAGRERQRAEDELAKAQRTQSRFMAELARQQRKAGDMATAALLALEALPDRSAETARPYVPEAELQLDGAWRDQLERRVLAGHAGNVVSATFSPDSHRVVTASGDGTAQLWDVETGQPIGEPLKGHLGRVVSATFSPDGKRVVTASDDKTARLWDGESGKPIGEPFKSDGAEVWGAAFSPDGKFIVTRSADEKIRLWEAETGKPIDQLLKGVENGLRNVAFSPDGKRIVTASLDGTSRLWEGATGKPIGEPIGWPAIAAFSPDGNRVASSSGDDTVYVWDAGTGRQTVEPIKGGNRVRKLAFSPDGRRIVTAFDDTARLWDSATGQPIGEPFKGHESTVIDAVFSPDGKRIVTASFDKTWRLWDGETGQPVGEPLEDREGPVQGSAFSRAGKHLLAASLDGMARLWDLETGQPIDPPLKGHQGAVLSAAFSPDGNRIVTASDDKTARIWDARTRKPISEPLEGHGNPLESALFSPDGKRIVTASHDWTARLWDGDTGQPIGEPLKGHEGAVLQAMFSPDSKRIITASDDKTARLWDRETGKPIGEPLRGHEGAVRRAAFSPDGKRIVTASDDKTARLWDGETGQPIGEPLRGHESIVTTAAFSFDGRRIVTASLDGTARQWDDETGKPIGEPLRGHGKPLSDAAFSPDGKRIVTASDDKTARLWDSATGRPIGEPLKGHEGAVFGVSFSPDGKRIVTRSEDATPRLWDGETGQPIGELKGHEDAIWSAVFSNDGRRIVTASFDKTARLWDADTGKPIGEPLRGHQGRVMSAAFSPNGTHIVTASEDSTARLWAVFADTQGLVSNVKVDIPRCLTAAQRIAFFLPPEPSSWCVDMKKWPYGGPVWQQWLADTRAGRKSSLPVAP